MIWLGIPKEDLVLDSIFNPLKQAIIKAEIAHVVAREAEAVLAEVMKTLDRIEKLKELQETAEKLGKGDAKSWADLATAVAIRPGTDPDAARVLAVASALLSSGSGWQWRPGFEMPAPIRLAASHAERCAILARDALTSGALGQIINAIRELFKARSEAEIAYQKELKKPTAGGKKLQTILVKSVDRITVRGSRALVKHRVLAGGDHAVALQDMGNDPREIEVVGVLATDPKKGGKGPKVDEQVAALQEALRAGKPLVFATDAPGLEAFGPTVLISEFEVLATDEMMGAVRFRYCLVESPPSAPKRGRKSPDSGPSKDWARLQAVKSSTAYVSRFVNPATGKLHARLDEAVRDQMLKAGTVTGLL